MRPIRLGAVRGIPIQLQPSGLLLPGLLGYVLAAQTLPLLAPGHTSVSYLLGGVLAGGGLLATLLGHETAHALVALRCGVRARSITLTAFGGVTELTADTTGPRGDLLVAGAGPAVSGLIGGVAVAAGAALRDTGVLGAALTWLGWANLVLAGFNLLPAAPLDGGRMLRALWWWRTGDRLRAAAVTGRFGTVLGGVLLFGGVAFLGSAGSLGLWSILVGAFLAVGGAREEAGARLRQRVHGLRVADLMTGDVVTGPDWLSVHAFVERVAAARPRSGYPLLDADGRYTGMVLASQLAAVPASTGSGVRVLRVGVPAEHAPSTHPDELVTAVLDRLGRRVPPVLPVLDPAGVPVGLLALVDVLNATRPAVHQH